MQPSGCLNPVVLGYFSHDPGIPVVPGPALPGGGGIHSARGQRHRCPVSKARRFPGQRRSLSPSPSTWLPRIGEWWEAARFLPAPSALQGRSAGPGGKGKRLPCFGSRPKDREGRRQPQVGGRAQPGSPQRLGPAANPPSPLSPRGASLSGGSPARRVEPGAGGGSAAAPARLGHRDGLTL